MQLRCPCLSVLTGTDNNMVHPHASEQLVAQRQKLFDAGLSHLCLRLAVCVNVTESEAATALWNDDKAVMCATHNRKI